MPTIFDSGQTTPIPGREARFCGCDCGGVTRGGRYLPGHDTRVAFRLLRDNEPA